MFGINITNILHLKTFNKNIPHILITNIKKNMTALYCYVHFKYSPVDYKANIDIDLVDNRKRRDLSLNVIDIDMNFKYTM